jgi:HEAT repeat protein
MGQSRDPATIPHLIEAVLDPDARVAVRATDYLGRLKATDATEFLSERLFLKSTSDPLRHQILGALARIGDSRALPPLLEFVKQTDRPKLRSAAIYALGEVGDSTIRDQMAAIAEQETDPNLKRLAEEALAKISGRPFEPTPLPTGFPDPLFRPIEPAP